MFLTFCDLFSRLDNVFSKPSCPSIFNEKVTVDCALLIELLTPSLGSCWQDWACTNSLIIAHYFEAYYCISCAFVLQCTEAVAVFAVAHPAMSLCINNHWIASFIHELSEWRVHLQCQRGGGGETPWHFYSKSSIHDKENKKICGSENSQCNTLHWGLDTFKQEAIYINE